MVTTATIWKLLDQVADPEIPVLTIADLGIVRTVEINENKCIVTITPTYSGCPAMHQIEEEILKALSPTILTEVKSTLSPAWTTDWMTEEARVKLEEYGIAPPQKGSADKNLLMGKLRDVRCPRCKSSHTAMVSQFGSTACKSLYKCEDCKEPFDYFKCI